MGDRIVIQRNPTSGSGRGAQQLKILIADLRQAGFRVRLFASRERMDAFLQDDQVRSEVHCLVAAGGDGTVASVAQRHPEFPVAVMPLGTENLVARHLRIPKCGRTASAVIRNGRTQVYDTAFVNDQRFLLMTSVGMDGDVVRRLSTIRSGNISHLSYARPMLSSLLKYDFPIVSVYGDDGELLAQGTHVIVTNIPEYGFRMQFSPNASPHDGQLDVRVFHGTGTFSTLMHMIRTRLGMSDRAGEVTRLTRASVELRSATDAPVQLDGDPAGSCPVRVRIEPASMTLMVRSDGNDMRGSCG